MKKLLSMAFMLSGTTLCFTQGNNWKLDGNNNVDQNSFIGSMNNEPFILKANGNEGLRIKPNGDLRIKNFDDNTYTGLTFINSNGVLSKLNFTGNYLDVLSGNGTFISLSNFATGWSLSNNITFTTNNVGIGTNIAPEKLTVNGNILANGSISGTSINVVDIVGAGKEIKIMNSLCLKGLDVNIPGSKNMICGMNGDLYVQSTSGNYNTIINQGNTGKVGIGVIPTEDFHVGKSAKFDGGVNFSNLSNSNSGDLLFIDPSGKISRGSMGALAAELYSVECLNDGSGNIIPTWHNGISKITTGGTQCEYDIKVGINTDSPINFLDVRGNTDIMGKLGINTTTPINDLDVRGNANIEQHLGVGLNTLNTNYKLHVKTTAETGIYVDASFTYDNLSAITTVIDRDLTKAFSVIDSRNGQENFKVNGNGFVYARRFWVTLDPFPDYVFSDNYDLMSLGELETYIDNNNHLPKIPTATEVSQNGVELGEMNRLLVEKVEELTLYLIEQNKKLEELSKEIELLKK